MKTMLVAGVALAASVAASASLAANAQVEAPVHQFIDDFNKGDAKGAAAAFLPSASIIDEVPPYHWSGASAFGGWAAALEADAKAHGDTGSAVTLGAVKRELISGDTAYVIFEATYSFKRKGVAMKEPSQMTYALKKTAAGWKIAAWTWTGPDPVAAK